MDKLRPTRRSGEPVLQTLGLGSPARMRAGISTNTGPLASAAWLVARGLAPARPDWMVEIELATGDSRFEIEIFAEEWGFCFEHEDRMSWIRVTDIPFAHGRDEHELLRQVSGLKHIGRVLALVEKRYALVFLRAQATIHTNLDDAEIAIRPWIHEL